MDNSGIGDRVRERSRSRSRNRNRIPTVPLLDGNRSLHRNARMRRQLQEADQSTPPPQARPEENTSTEPVPPSPVPNTMPLSQQEQEQEEQPELKEDESVLRDIASSISSRISDPAALPQVENQQFNHPVHPERQAQIPNHNDNHNQQRPNQNNTFMQILQGLQQQIAQLQIQQTNVSNTAMPGFNTREQQTKLTIAETSSVYRNLTVPDLMVETARPTPKDRKQYK